MPWPLTTCPRYLTVEAKVTFGGFEAEISADQALEDVFEEG